VERALFAFVRRAPSQVVAAIVLALYAVGGLAVPLVLHVSRPMFVLANVLGTSWAAAIGLAWFLVQMDALRRRNLLEWTTDLHVLHAWEFEWLVGEIFRREGWKVKETGRHDGPDGNIDLELRRDAERKIVQCKRWTSAQVGVEEIRSFGGTLLREGLPGEAGIFVTLSQFTAQAATEGRTMGIELVDNRALHSRMERARRPEPCPVCDAPMRLAHSAYGWWFRCGAPGCLGKRDLSRDPGRALELLTQA
jgi:hypothetical protein